MPTPNKAMQAAAQTALDYNDSVPSSQRWGTTVGRRRARKIAAGGDFDRDEISQISAFLSRFAGDYEKQRAAGKYGKGYYAYMGWGGPSGLAWAKDKLSQIDNQ